MASARGASRPRYRSPSFALRAPARLFGYAVMICIGLSLSGCYGVGFTELNTHSFWNNQTAEDKTEDIWWDRYYGQRGLPTESKAWKDYYKPTTGQEVPKPAYCGYWGNCPNSEASENPSCSFYGNCPKH